MTKYATRLSRTRSISTPISKAAPHKAAICPRCRSSNQTAISMATRPRRSSTCSKALSKRLSIWLKQIRRSGPARLFLLRWTRGGGYYDSGYVQLLDFFGDGTRIPMIVVSPYSTGGHISHTYTDHVSVLKFIEANWNVPPITKRSRDNLPNPTTGADPYKPTNGPAIGDLMDLFKFPKS